MTANDDAYLHLLNRFRTRFHNDFSATHPGIVTQLQSAAQQWITRYQPRMGERPLNNFIEQTYGAWREELVERCAALVMDGLSVDDAYMHEVSFFENLAAQAEKGKLEGWVLDAFEKRKQQETGKAAARAVATEEVMLRKAAAAGRHVHGLYTLKGMR